VIRAEVDAVKSGGCEAAISASSLSVNEEEDTSGDGLVVVGEIDT
jgi:hypothetical protein